MSAPVRRSYVGIAATAALSGLLIACADADAPPATPDAVTTGQAADVDVPASVEQATRPGIRFDPASLEPGDSVGVLVADSVAASRNVVDSTYVGMARFSGEIELTGRVIDHFDADMAEQSVCFEADAESATRLPRWLHDERRPWFCFENVDEARRPLDSAGDDVAITIVVDEFTIHRGLSDEVNSARLVRVAGLPGAPIQR